MSYAYDKLDLTQIVDRMGFTNSFTYDSMRRRTAHTDAMCNTTRYVYCNCGSLDFITNALDQVTQFVYDRQGKLLETHYADGYRITNSYNLLGQKTSVSDGSWSIANTYNNQGLLVCVSENLPDAMRDPFLLRQVSLSTRQRRYVAVGVSYQKRERDGATVLKPARHSTRQNHRQQLRHYIFSFVFTLSHRKQQPAEKNELLNDVRPEQEQRSKLPHEPENAGDQCPG